MEQIVNAVGRQLPKYIEGYGEVKPYKGTFETKVEGRKYAPTNQFLLQE